MQEPMNLDDRCLAAYRGGAAALWTPSGWTTVPWSPPDEPVPYHVVERDEEEPDHG
jgi:hypothetical protein